jgi:hypothetical protein
VQLGEICDVIDCSEIELLDLGYDDSGRNTFQDDLEKWEVITQVPLPSRGLTIGNTIWIHMHRDDTRFMSLLRHEITHVWQNQTGGIFKGFAIGVGNAISQIWRNPYDISGYTPSKPFGQYGYEQQAEIARRCNGGVTYYCSSPGYPF